MDFPWSLIPDFRWNRFVSMLTAFWDSDLNVEILGVRYGPADNSTVTITFRGALNTQNICVCIQDVAEHGVNYVPRYIEQTVDLEAAWAAFGTNVVWEAPAADRPAITDPSLLPSTGDRFFSRIRINSSGQVALRIASDTTTANPTATDEDLADDFEERGYVVLEVDGRFYRADLDGSDTTDPYIWTPTDAASMQLLHERYSYDGTGDRPLPRAAKLTFGYTPNVAKTAYSLSRGRHHTFKLEREGGKSYVVYIVPVLKRADGIEVFHDGFELEDRMAYVSINA